MSTPSEEFHLLPLILPDDLPGIAQIHHQIYLHDTLHAHARLTPPLSLPLFITATVPNLLLRFSPSPHSSTPQFLSKIVSSTSPSHLLAYIRFTPPMTSIPTKEERERELKEEIDRGKAGMDKEFMFKMKKEDLVSNERFLGEGYEGKWWCLENLAVDEGWQRKGLGSRLVREGVERIKRMVREEEKKVEGIYLTASPQGARTYEKCGFVRVGEKSFQTVVEGKEEGYTHAWYVYRF